MSATWIACADEMPDDCISVMTYSPLRSDPVWPGFYGDDGWNDLFVRRFRFPVTHWQHFPEPPEV